MTAGVEASHLEEDLLQAGSIRGSVVFHKLTIARDTDIEDAIPAGSAWPPHVGVAELCNTAGLAGITASAPITFDRRQSRRQVRAAKGLTKTAGPVPLLAQGGKIPVGGTIRAIGHRCHRSNSGSPR